MCSVYLEEPFPLSDLTAGLRLPSPTPNTVFICGIKVDKLNLMANMLLVMHGMRGGRNIFLQ